jgi:hypothetical protein
MFNFEIITKIFKNRNIYLVDYTSMEGDEKEE